jgi:hypothetical protein
MARALDEGSGLIDRIRELNLLPCHIVVEPASAIANQIADDKRDLESIATKARLIATYDHIAALSVIEHLSQAGPSVEVITRSPIVHVGCTLDGLESESLDRLPTSIRLDIETELLLALIVLRPSAVRSNSHVNLRSCRT